jgi:sporulation protein YqfC
MMELSIKSKRSSQTKPSTKTKRLSEQVERTLELPVGSLSGAVRMELSGNRRAVIDGGVGIVEYNDDVIRLNTGSGIVRFTGRGLSMSCLTEESAVVEGHILSLEFLS